LGLTFFGLTPKYREHIFTRIHEIVFFGKGGYDWDTVYNMPIRYRDFIYKQIRDHYEKEAKKNENQAKTLKNQPPVKPKNNPTYTAKMRPQQK
jgi:hypothetical protein